MANNPIDNLRRLYQNGLKHFDLPDFDTFQQDMKDEQKRKRFYTNMQNAYDLPDFNTFSKDIGAVAVPKPTSAQPQQAQTASTIAPIKDNTAAQATVQAPAAQPAKATQQQGWKPTPVQQMAFDMQMNAMNARLQEQKQEFNQRMEGIKKGSKPGAFMGEREFNPKTGKLETNYYTIQGDRVNTQLEQSHRNTEYNQWWENNTEEGRKSKERRLQSEFDERLATLWQRHDPAKGENAAEQAWSAAEKRQKAARDKNASEIYKSSGNAFIDALNLGGRENHIMNGSLNSHRNQVAQLTNFDLDRLMNDSWNNLGANGQKSLIDDCYNMLRYRNPGADKLTLYNQAKELARHQSDLRLYNLAVEKNLPKGNLDYLLRKINDANLLANVSKGLAVSEAKKTGDMAAYEAANEQYRQDGHKILSVTGTVAGFAFDPTTWISGGVGSAFSKGALWAGGRYLAGRGATAAVTQAATRKFATSLTGRVLGGVVGGAANFGTYEGVKEAETQFAHGGHVVGQDDTGKYINEGYSGSAIAGSALHGTLMGGLVGWLTPVSGNVADKLVSRTSSTIGKVAERAGVYAGATMAEGTIFSVPEWIEGDRDGFDVWTDNMAMMVGFKAKHMLKSAGSVLGDLKASFESPTNGRKNRLDFESRLRQRMDEPSEDSKFALTKDEEAELKRYGYDLRELVESQERQGINGTDLITEDAPQIVSRLSDMMADTRVSEAARAKIYYYATGRKLPMSTIMKGELLEDGKGGFIVQSQGANGVITSRSFKNRKEADLEMRRINRQVELNSVEVGERYQQTTDFEKRLQDACRTVANQNGWDAVEVYKTCEEARRNYLRGVDKQFDEAQQNILRKVTKEMGDFEETGVTDAMRGSINDKYGVDIDKAIRKEPNRRTQAEQSAIDEYIDELIPNKVKENPVEEADAEDITDQKLITNESDEPTDNGPIDPRFDGGEPIPDTDPHQPDGEQKPIGRAVMKYKDRQVEVLSGRIVLVDDGTMIDNERSDNSIVIRDIATGEIEMVAPDAILSYEEYPSEPAEGADVPQGQGTVAETPAEPQQKYTSGQITIRNSDGTETRGIFTGYVDEDGKHEYYVEGDLQHLHYATEAELDNMLSDYKPDAPQEPAEPQQSVEPQVPGDVINAEEYKKAYASQLANLATISDEKLSAYVAANSGFQTPMDDDYTRGAFDACVQELQRRTSKQQPAENVQQPAEDVQKSAENVQEQPISVQNGEETVQPQMSEEQLRQSADAAFQQATQGNNGGFTLPQEQVEAMQQHNQQLYEQEQQRKEAEANRQPTPLERIPRNENGEPIFEQAESPDVAWDALVEFSGGDVGTAKEIADAMAEEKRKAYEKAQKLKLKGKTPTEMLASKQANAAELAQAESEYNHWQRMANVEQSRQNAIRAQQEAEARQRAAERAEAEKAEREAREEAERREREALDGIPEWHMDTPENARKRGARRYGGQMFTRQEPLSGVEGKEVEVKFSQKDLPKGNVAVIEAEQLQPSHIQGHRNPMFFIEEAQPKNRAEGVSQDAARTIAEGIRPEEITSSTTAYTGAPTVNARGEVIQGNNRSDALRYLWQHNLPEQQQAYKQYLLDNAEQLGLDPNAIEAMQHPVLVNKLDVDDAEAIRLGQMTAQDTESGGVERIKPKNVAQKLGDGMRTFANRLLSSSDNDATFGQLVDRNGEDVLNWMNQIGAISSTQYQSAFDSKGNLTAEAKNDLQKVLYQAVFKGGSQQLEEMFDRLPAKAQRAILSTAFRDMDSPFGGKMLPEIQSSIIAYNTLMQDEGFASAKNMEEVLRAIETFKHQTALDDRFEQYMPADNFSNFALHLAGLYKANDMSQTTIASYFNEMYDLAQGKKAATLFEEADTNEYPLAEVIKKVLGIEYKPAKNGNNNVANGGADVALRNQESQGGQLRGNEPPASGEQNQTGTEPSERGGGTENYGSAGGGKGNLPPTEEREESGENEENELDENGRPFIKAENGTTVFGEITDDSGLTAAPIKLSEGFQDANTGKGYGLLHIEANHGVQIRQAGFTSVEEFVSFVATHYDPDNIRVGKRRDDGSGTFLIQVTDTHDNTLFIELSKDGSYWNVNSGGIFRKGYSNKKETVAKTEPQQPTNAVSSDSSLSANVKDGITNAEPNGEPTVSLDKGTTLPSDTQTSKEEKSEKVVDSEGENTLQGKIDAASADVNTEPTEAQKEAGNYKKGHVQVGTFNITIEQPKGSIRRGTDANGKQWESEMHNTYGYFRGTEGVDGDHIDVFLSNNIDGWNGRKVFVVDQYNPDGSFDEHKVMLGFNDIDEAISDYLANYEKGWENGRRITVSATNLEDFEKWIDSSHRKTKPFSEYSSVNKETMANTPAQATPAKEAAPTKEADGTGAAYTIEPSTYTNKKGKTSDVSLLKFNGELTPEQERAVKEFAKERMGEGRFAPARGWKDRESGGWMFRNEEDARKAAEMVGNDEAVADAQPMTAQELRDAVEPKQEKPKRTAKQPKPANKVESSPAKEEKPQYEVSDEELGGLLNDIRDILGIGDDEGDAGFHFRDPDELTAEQRQKLMSVGQRAAMAFVERGNESFGDYATMMVKALGDKVRPWLKAFYGGLEYVPGYDKYALTPYEEVKAFDVENFDKPQKDVLAQANMIVEEGKAQVAADKANNELKAKRNEQRKEADEQRAADTTVVAEEAETVASEAEALAETSNDEQAINASAEQVDEALGKVNDQLALLGYYEADRVEKDYNEAYGYMRNAEKKAVKDAANLADNLIDDLGLDRFAATHAPSLRGGAMKKKPLAVANIAPIGGDITIHLPLNDGHELYMDISLHPTSGKGHDTAGDDLEVDGIMYRVDGKQYGNNQWADTGVTYADLLKGIQRVAYKYLPGRSEPKNGEYHSGDKVQYSPDGGRTWSEGVVINPDDNGYVLLDTGLAPVMYVSATHDQLRHKTNAPKDEDIFQKAERIAKEDKAKREKARKEAEIDATDLPKPAKDKAKSALHGSDSMTDNAALAEAERRIEKKKTAKKVEPQQSVGDLFAGTMDEEPEAETKVDRNSDIHRTFANTVKNDMLASLDNGTKPYRGIIDLRKRAKELGMDVDNDGRTDILLQELVEDGLVRAAREVSERVGSGSKEAYDLICKLYDLQPTISARSSNRIKMQQYSTPLPMAWNADHFAMHGKDGGLVLEPTAGNGMLVFGVPAGQVHANELDETRLANLREQGFAEVTQQDATEPFEGGQKYDAIISNPPFGKREAAEYDGKMIGGLDPQITLNALASMKDDGRAAIIIGGNMEYAANGGIKNMKPFFTYLYDHYNVKGVVDMDGKLYAKQGTTFPTRMILIDGRRSEEERAQSAVYPPVKSKAVRKAESFEDLYNIIDEITNSPEKTNGTEILRSQQGGLLPVADKSSGTTDRERHSEQPRTNDEAGRRGARTGNKPASTPNGSQPVLSGERGKNNGNGVSERRTGGDNGGASRGNTEPVVRGVDGVGVSTHGVGLSPTVHAEPKKRGLTDEKIAYRPHSTAFSLESVAPAAMVEAMDNVLTQIEKEHGSIDNFVTKELGYDSVEDAHHALAAEQMDSVAMAVYQMKHGQALIIGDQTGVGKGRQMAALIRWAVKRGEKPVFITQKADLFSDIYRDLVDIGSGDLVPFIFNSPSGKENKGEIVDANGKVVYKGLSDAKMKKVMASGKLPDGYDFAVLTYSQVNTGDDISQKEFKEAAKQSGTRTKKSKSEGKPTPKATFLRAIAKDNYLFLDESHTAAGTSNTGAYLQSILRSAKAATFASATFAKRPDTMPLYAIRTAMSQANVEPAKMISIIEKGGVTLQEIMSRELTNAGQMVRRERDMSDVRTDWKTIDDAETVRKAKENYDKTIAAFNAIIKFQEDYVKPMIDNLDQELAIMAESAGVKRGTDKMGVDNVPFASKTYNYTKQLMLALKVDAIADEVEKEIHAGRHPVIALESTMESSIKDYAAGETIDEPTFSASLLKGLDSVMQYTVKDEDGNERHAQYLPSDLGEAGEKAYYELQNLIRESTSDIFISPLDAIIDRLHEKGYKVGELTGRNMYVERGEDGKVVVKRRTDKDKKRMQREFNNGELDVLILNKSASTGISLHASEKFSDQRQRSMIIAQPLSDINDYMQMIGRIDRTGQVHRGYYINLGLPVPAENRFLMMLSTKLKSLNANTTTSQDSESNEVDAPDLLNKYGSQVVVEYLRDNPEVYEKMGAPLKKGGLGGGKVMAKDLDEYKPQEDDARKITGYVALLSTKEQEDFYDDVVRRYNELIKYLNDTGNNDLKITVMPLRAKTLEKRVSSAGIDPNGNNPFAQNSYVEKVEMDVLRKPMKADDVRKTIEQVNKGKSPEDYMRHVVATINAEDAAKLEAEDVRYEKDKQSAQESIAKQAEKINAQKKRTAEEKASAIASFTEEKNAATEAKHNQNVERIKVGSRMLKHSLNQFEVGKSYLVPDNLESQMFDFAAPAIFCGYKTKDSKITASTTLAVFATLDGRRRVEVKLSQLGALQSIDKMTNDNWDSARSTTLDNWDSQIPTETRKEGYIMTGNILQAIADTQDERGGYPGQLISYTDIDGNVHDGILMPDKWNSTMLKSSGVPLISRMQQIKDFKPVTSHDGKVEITGSAWTNMYYLTVPKTKKEGGIFFENNTLLGAALGHNFYPYHGKLRADISGKNIENVVKELTRLGVKAKEDNPASDTGKKFRLLEDDDPKAQELEALPESELVPVYRNVQAFQDDALGSPMAFFDAETGERRTLEGRRWNYSEAPKVELTEEQQRKLDELNANGYLMVDGKKMTELPINDGLKFVKPKTKEAQLQYLLKKNPEDSGTWAAYDPYDHAIETPLNTQFGEAYKRPNLVVVRSLIPKSEIDEPFHADYALLPTGAHQWNNGRTLYLSRWSKIDKVLSREEEAKLIDEYWKKHPGKREALKTHRDYNRFVPEVRKELEKMGYRFEHDGKVLTPEESLALDQQREADVIPGREGHLPYITGKDIERINAKMAGKWVGEPKEAMENEMAARVEDLSKKLGTPVRIIRTDEEVAALPTPRQRRQKGSFNSLTGEVTIVVPNNANLADIENTFIHEVVGHDGLRVLFSTEEKLNNALDELYRVSNDSIKHTIDRMAQKMYDAEVDRLREKKRKEHEAKGEDAYASYNVAMAEAHVEANKKREQFKRDATEEYGADLAGRIGDSGFEKMSAEELTFWGKLKAMLQKALQKLLSGLKIPGKKAWGDKEWAFVLHEAYKRKKNGGKPTVFDAADTEVMKRKTGFDEAMTNGDAVKKERNEELNRVNERFNEQVIRLTEENADKTVLSLGRPSAKLQSAGVKDKPMKLYGNKVMKKMRKHGFALEELRDLPKAVANPITVFNNYQREGNRSILTELETKDGNFLVTLELGKDGDIDFNIVSSVFGKGFNNIVDWYNKGYATYIDKEKALSFLYHQSAPIAATAANAGQSSSASLSSASQYVQQEIDKQVLDDAAKVVENFENPKVSDENVADNEGILFRDGDSVDYEKAQARNLYEERVSRGMYQMQEALQDSMLGLKEAMMAVLKAEGKDVDIEDVDGHENAYLGENRLSSVNQAECEEFARRLFKPMLAEVAKLAKTADERAALTDYMMAKHGLERNEVMARRAAAKDARKEFYSELRDAERAVIKDPLDQDAQDALDDVKQRMHDREEELYFENRSRDYSGLTALTGMDNVVDAEMEAERMVRDYESGHDTAELWGKVFDVTQSTLHKAYASGMIDRNTYNDIRTMYKNYIPLRGFDEKTSEEAYSYLRSRESMFNAPIKTAKGRKSKADDPFANMEAMAESAIMQGNRNVLVKQKFLNFALKHPSDLVSVSDLWLRYDDAADEWRTINTGDVAGTEALEADDSPAEVERKMEDFEEAMKQLQKKEPTKYRRQKEDPTIPYRVVNKSDLREHQVLVKRNGRDYVLTVNGNPRAAQALNGETNPDNDQSGAIGAVLHWGEAVNRQLSAFYTTRNPDFVVSNFVRDMLYANTMVWVKESGNYAWRFHQNFARVNPVVMKHLLAKLREGKLDRTNPLEKQFREFMLNGGETGYSSIKDIERRKNDIKRELKMYNGKLPMRKVWMWLGERLDEYNRAVENCARFAAYLTSRQMKRSIERSVYDAKEISVNFNKKGSGAKFMGDVGQTKAGNAAAFVSGLGRSGYVFWNAAVQGTTNFGKQAVRHPKKAFAGMAAMYLLGVLMAALGHDDEDNKDNKNSYYNLPEYVRRNNIVFRMPGMDESWVSIPLTVEYRPMYGLGELTVSVLSGKEHYTGGEIASQIAGQISQMLPIDMMEGSGGWKPFVPSAIKPFAEVWTNEGWTGMPIYKDTPWNKDDPEWTKAYKSANGTLVGLSKSLNEMTGGDPYTKGWIDINPSKVEYLLNGYFGGVSNTVDKLVKMGETAVGKRDYDPRSFLIANRLLKSGDERTEQRAINNEYFRLKEEHDKLKARLRHYEDDTANGVFDYAEKISWLNRSPEYRRMVLFEEYKPDIDAIARELKEPMSDKERKSLEAELNALKKELVDAANKEREQQ